jgi:hypothetical protein
LTDRFELEDMTIQIGGKQIWVTGGHYKAAEEELLGVEERHRIFHHHLQGVKLDIRFYDLKRG